MGSVTINVDMTIKKELFDKFEHPDDQAMLKIHNLLAKEFNDFVPMDEGVLSQSVQVSPERILYPGPYARFQYYGYVMTTEDGRVRAKLGEKKPIVTDRPLQYNKEKHSLATKEWDKAAMEIRGDSIRAQVKEILKRGFNRDDH